MTCRTCWPASPRALRGAPDDGEPGLAISVHPWALPRPDEDPSRRAGLVGFDRPGKLAAIRALWELDGILRRAGEAWEPGSRRWLPRVGPVIGGLRKATDPSFRRSGIALG